MSDGSIIVCGLPETGKTTYLAALWEILQDGGPDKVLKLASHDYNNYEHVRRIHRRWVRGQRQDRTDHHQRNPVGLDLVDNDGHTVTLEFPDLGGEIFASLWERRSCDEDVAELLARRLGTMLFIHADNIVRPRDLIGDLAAIEHLGGSDTNGNAISYSPSLSPCQVKLVDLLQSLQSGPIEGQTGRLAIVLSAWDRVTIEDLTPEQHLSDQLPLLDQYLKLGDHDWEPKIFGVSAQGTEYVSSDHEGALPERLLQICGMEHAYKRIRVIGDGHEDHDLTRPIAWVTK